MSEKLRKTATGLTLVALFFMLTPAPVRPAAPAGARLEGLVSDLDGRPAKGYTVHLIGPQGSDLASATTAEDGQYAFRDLPAGEYSMGIESPVGRMAPVAAPPLRVADHQLARRDLKLIRGERQDQLGAVRGNPSVGLWWAGLSPAAKVWAILGTVAVVGITVAALDDGSQEQAASPF